MNGADPPPCEVPCAEDGLPYDLSGCRSVQVMVLFDIDRARAFLPNGYAPKDGGHLAGQNPGSIPLGKANLGVAAWSCEHVEGLDGPAAWFSPVIDIEPPRVPNVTSPSPHPAYDVLHAVSSPAHLRYLDAARLPVVLADVDVDVDQTGSIGLGRVHVQADGVTLVDFEIVTAGLVSGQGTLGSWHQTPEGVALTVFTGTQPLDVAVGEPIRCTFAEDTLLADLIGSTDCMTGAAVSYIFGVPAVDGAITFHPGLQAEG